MEDAAGLNGGLMNGGNAVDRRGGIGEYLLWRGGCGSGGEWGEKGQEYGEKGGEAHSWWRVFNTIKKKAVLNLYY